MEGVEGMYSVEATSTQELDGDTVETAVKAVFMTQFTTAVSEDPPAFQTNELVKEKLTFFPPYLQGVILTAISSNALKETETDIPRKHNIPLQRPPHQSLLSPHP